MGSILGKGAAARQPQRDTIRTNTDALSARLCRSKSASSVLVGMRAAKTE